MKGECLGEASGDRAKLFVKRTGRNDGHAGPSMLAGLRVIEIPDERVEYTGLLLAGLGAEDLREAPAREHLLRLLDGAGIPLDASCGALNDPWPWIAPRSTLASRCW